MTDTHSDRGYTRDTEPVSAATAWVGWVLFAGVMLVLEGSFQFIAGLVALFQRSYYHVAPHDMVLHLNYTTWGWLQMALGVLAVTAGYGVMAGKLWARIYAIAVVGIGAIANLAFTAAYPVWGVIFITIDILVIWAIAVHGREIVRVAD